jgi:hypothetical protein
MSINSLTWVHFGDLHMEGASEQNHTYPADLKVGTQRLIASNEMSSVGVSSHCALPGRW